MDMRFFFQKSFDFLKSSSHNCKLRWLFCSYLCSAEFWDLYKTCLEEKVTKGNTRICFYGAVSNKEINKAFKEWVTGFVPSIEILLYGDITVVYIFLV